LRNFCDEQSKEKFFEGEMKLLLRLMLILFSGLCAMQASALAHETFAATAARSTVVVFGAQSTPADNAASTAAANSEPTEASQKKVTAYTLPPDRYQKALNLGRFHFRFNLISFFYGLFVLWIILRFGLAPKYRDWAEKASRNSFVQALIFAPLFFLTMGVLGLPSDVYEYTTERKYGLSIQNWSSWFWDWTKGELLSLILGVLLIWILYAVIRKSPRRWWFCFWLVSLPIAVFLIFLQPLVIDPMFHKFEPLQQKDPALTASLERMVQRAGQNIPPERMFWMGAGEKTTTLNAYVTGIGSSKRIVVWDTTIAKMTTPQIVFVAGHEMGHYVLGHIWKGLIFAAVLSFVLFFLAFRTIGWFLTRWGAGWGIRGVNDLASLPALLLLISIFAFIAGPISSAFSRHDEHQADQYGLEVTHGLTPDAPQVAAQAFQILGEVDLSNPEPNLLDVLMFYSHPAIPDRIRFALTYDPWSKGESGEFVK
jgi:Zn-dependent protease with chaperone function